MNNYGVIRNEWEPEIVVEDRMDPTAGLAEYLTTVIDIQKNLKEQRGIRNNVTAYRNKIQQMPQAPEKTVAPVSMLSVLARCLAGAVLVIYNWQIWFFSGHVFTKGLFLMGLGLLVYTIVTTVTRIRQTKTINQQEENRWNNELSFRTHKKEELDQVTLPKVNELIAGSEEALERLYALDIIAAPYRNLEACVTILQYFQTGRTSSLVRNGADPGAYNMWEEELRSRKVVDSIEKLGNKMDVLLQYQKNLYDVTVEINNNTKRISDQLINMHQDVVNQLNTLNATSALTAYNTAKTAEWAEQTAWYAQQTADNTRAIKFAVNHPKLHSAGFSI